MAKIETVSISFNGETRDVPIKVFPTHAYTVEPLFITSEGGIRRVIKGRLQMNYEKTRWLLDLSHGANEGELQEWYNPNFEMEPTA